MSTSESNFIKETANHLLISKFALNNTEHILRQSRFGTYVIYQNIIPRLVKHVRHERFITWGRSWVSPAAAGFDERTKGKCTWCGIRHRHFGESRLQKSLPAPKCAAPKFYSPCYVT